MEFTCGIYMILNLKNGKFYIGGSSKIDWRWKLHRNRLKSGGHNHLIQPDWDLYGPESFEILLLEETSEDNLSTREQFWLDSTSSSYNVATKALNNIGKGIKLSEDTKHKIRLANTGRKLSPEQCEQLGNRGRGKSLSQEHRNKIASALIGHSFSQESIQKMSNTRKGMPSGRKGKILSQETKDKISASRIRLFEERRLANING